MIIITAFLNITGKYTLYCYKVRVGSQIKGLAANAANHAEPAQDKYPEYEIKVFI